MVMVLESIFGFDLSLPLNYLLKGFEEKTLVIQVFKIFKHLLDPQSNFN